MVLIAVYLAGTAGLPVAATFTGMKVRCGCSLERQQTGSCCCCQQTGDAGPVETKACCRVRLTTDSTATTKDGHKDAAVRPCCRGQLAAAESAPSTELPEQPELRSCGCQMRPFGEIGINAEPRLAGTRIQLTVLPICCRLHAVAALFPSRSIAPETPPPRV